MENIRIKQAEVNQSSFEKHSVWTWDENTSFNENEDWMCPVIETNPISREYVSVFVKAEFSTQCGLKLSGYIISDGFEVFCIGVFFENEEYLFNIRLKDLSKIDSDKLKEALNTNQEIFPLSYNTGFEFEDGNKIEGFFDISK